MIHSTKIKWSTYLLPLIIAGCGSSSNDVPESINSVNNNGTPALEKLYTYRLAADSISTITCSTLFLSSDSCDVADIKPIGANVAAANDVSLQDIANRLVVSHDWMAINFLSALEKIDDQDFLNLFKPLNTIVISYDIRPSFYHPYTASIYIDPRYLWKESSEWNSIYEQDDFREAYQAKFSFDAFARYIDADTNNYVIWSNTFKTYYNKRTSAQIAPGLFRLLSHELAHANDFLPPELLSNLGSNGKIYHDYISSSTSINTKLSNQNPLTSNLLFEAAAIAYTGDDMTPLIQNTSAYEIGAEFENDGAADLYAYSKPAEDVAMLFETFMMYKKYGAIRDVAFVDVPTSKDYECDDYIVKWGQRNRLADNDVKERAKQVASMILNRDIGASLSSLPSEPIDLQTDIGWCSSRNEVTSYQAISTKLRSTLSSTPTIHDYEDDRIRE